MNQKYLSVEEAAERLGKDPRTVQRWCTKGVLTGARKAGPFRNSPWVIPESEVVDYEEKYLVHAS